MSKRINQHEEKLKQLVGTYELRGLYRLRSACWDVLDVFNNLPFLKLDESATYITDVFLKITNRIKEEFPGTCNFIDFDKMVHEAIESYLLQRHQKKDVSEKSGKRKIAKKKVVMKRSERRKTSEWRKVLEPIDKLKALSESRIYEEDWDAREKAELFLAENTVPEKDHEDLEALIYLRSRGIECDESIAKVIQQWKNDANNVIEKFAQGNTIINLDDNDEPPKRFGKKSLSEASQIEKWHSLGLDNFWGHGASDNTHYEATILRAVEWCEIGGFDPWWKRWAKELRQGVDSGLDKLLGSEWLFNLCRSDFAISIAGVSLEQYLFQLQTLEMFSRSPWEVSSERGKTDSPAIAAAILFITHKLGCTNTDKGLLAEAGESIVKTQDSTGGWSPWPNELGLQVETTAMVIHALALAKPRGWKHAVKAGVRWLWSKQSKMGCWPERGYPDPAYTTVLVLDAIDLAEGKTNLTFKLPNDKIHSTEKKHGAVPIAEKILIDLNDFNEGTGSRNLLEDLIHDSGRKGVHLTEARHGKNQPRDLRAVLREKDYPYPHVADNINSKKKVVTLDIPFHEITTDPNEVKK